MLPRGVLVVAAFLGAVVVGAVALLGPLGLGVIQYRTSQSGVWQAMGVAAVVVAVSLILLSLTPRLIRREEMLP